jgi:hypothetical protein
VRYVEQLTRYRELFGPERMLVLLYDDFRADNEATVRAVLEFLGLPPDAGVKGRRANPTVHVRSQRLNELLHAVSVGHGPASLAAKRAIKALTPRALRRGALQAAKTHLVYGAPPPVDEGFMRELRERYRPEVRALAEYLGRDLETLWRYRDV